MGLRLCNHFLNTVLCQGICYSIMLVCAINKAKGQWNNGQLSVLAVLPVSKKLESPIDQPNATSSQTQSYLNMLKFKTFFFFDMAFTQKTLTAEPSAPLFLLVLTPSSSARQHHYRQTRRLNDTYMSAK